MEPKRERRAKELLPHEKENYIACQKLIEKSDKHAERVMYRESRGKAFVYLLRALDLSEPVQRPEIYKKIDNVIQQSSTRSDLIEGLVLLNKKPVDKTNRNGKKWLPDDELSQYLADLLHKNSDTGNLFWKKGDLSKEYVSFMIKSIPDVAVKKALLIEALGCDSMKSSDENKQGYLFNIIKEKRLFFGTGARESLQKELDRIAPGLRAKYDQNEIKSQVADVRGEVELPAVNPRNNMPK